MKAVFHHIWNCPAFVVFAHVWAHVHKFFKQECCFIVLKDLVHFQDEDSSIKGIVVLNGQLVCPKL